MYVNSSGGCKQVMSNYDIINAKIEHSLACINIARTKIIGLKN